jgi:hypothetical protein
MATCRGCGAAIIWIRTPGGKSIPCDPEQVLYRSKKGGSIKIVTPNGEVISAELESNSNDADGIGYVSHFATCPEAGRFRKRKEARDG